MAPLGAIHSSCQTCVPCQMAICSSTTTYQSVLSMAEEACVPSRLQVALAGSGPTCLQVAKLPGTIFTWLVSGTGVEVGVGTGAGVGVEVGITEAATALG